MTADALVSKLSKSEVAKSYLLEILEAFQNMDYHRLNDLLEDRYYEDMKKPSFIYRQKNIFEEFRAKGDTKLNISTNICSGCLCNEPVFVFSGNLSGLKYAVYFEFMVETITDIYKCYEQSNYGLDEYPF